MISLLDCNEHWIDERAGEKSVCQDRGKARCAAAYRAQPLFVGMLLMVSVEKRARLFFVNDHLREAVMSYALGGIFSVVLLAGLILVIVSLAIRYRVRKK
jgi:hypothetical protein